MKKRTALLEKVLRGMEQLLRNYWEVTMLLS